jgi:hypothetical protein
MELCRKPVVVVTTSSFFGSACKRVAANAATGRQQCEMVFIF